MSGHIPVVRNAEPPDGAQPFAWLVLDGRNIFPGWSFELLACLNCLFVVSLFLSVLLVIALLPGFLLSGRSHQPPPPSARRMASVVFCEFDRWFTYQLLNVNKRAWRLTEEERHRLLRAAVKETMAHGDWDLIVDVELPESGVRNGAVARAIGESECDGILLADGGGVPVRQLHGPRSPLYGGRHSYLPYMPGRPMMATRRPAPKTPRSSTDSRFAVHSDGHPLGAALDRLGTRTGLTICYEDYAEEGRDEPLVLFTHAPVMVSLEDVTVWEALDALSEATRAFVWSRDGDVVNIVAPGCLRVAGYAANRHLPRVRARGTWRDIMALLGEWAGKAAPNLSVGKPEPPHEDDAYHGPRVSVDLQGVSLRSFLNALARRTGSYWFAVYRARDDVMELYMHQHVCSPAKHDIGRAAPGSPSRPSGRSDADLAIEPSEPVLYQAWPAVSPESTLLTARTPAPRAKGFPPWVIALAGAAPAVVCGLWLRRRRKAA